MVFAACSAVMFPPATSALASIENPTGLGTKELIHCDRDPLRLLNLLGDLIKELALDWVSGSFTAHFPEKGTSTDGAMIARLILVSCRWKGLCLG